MILTLEPSCHFLRLLHSLLTMVVLLLLRVIAFCLCLSRQSQSTAWQGRADIDVSTSKSYCVLLRVFLWIPFSFLTYIFSWPSFLAYITLYMLAVTGLHSLSLIRHFLRTKINTVPSFGFLLELFESLATWLVWKKNIKPSICFLRILLGACKFLSSQRLRWSRGNVVAFGTQFRGFKPYRSRRIFQGEKILSTPSFRREVKPFAPCRRFTACKRSLNVTWKSGIFRQNFIGHFSPK